MTLKRQCKVWLIRVPQIDRQQQLNFTSVELGDSDSVASLRQSYALLYGSFKRISCGNRNLLIVGCLGFSFCVVLRFFFDWFTVFSDLPTELFRKSLEVVTNDMVQIELNL